jgi:hypothetical protein
MNFPTFLSDGQDCQIKSVVEDSPCKKPGGAWPGSGSIKSRSQRAQERGFGGQGICFIGAFFQLDSGDSAEQTEMPALQAIGIGNAVTGQSFSQVFGFADIEDLFASVAHEINAGTIGRLAEEVGS